MVKQPPMARFLLAMAALALVIALIALATYLLNQ
jgi:hypothetical protein